MKRAIKIFALVLTVAMAMCIGVFAAGCNEEKATDYTVTVVYPDNKAVDGTKDGKAKYDPEDKSVAVQICVVLANGETGTCFTKVNLSADGKATLPAPDYTLKEGEKFKIQVNNVPEGYKCNDNREYVYYVTAPGAYTVTLEVDA